MSKATESVDNSSNKDSDSVSGKISVKSCWCGGVKFHILTTRQVVCSECFHYVENEMVFHYDGGVIN